MKKNLYYTTAELARLVGISKNTLLRWEEEKLIPPALRDGRGWRVWTKEALENILETKKSKDFKRTHNKGNRLRINIIGYGNQGAVWAKNLKDFGAVVKILLRKDSPSIRIASNDGFDVVNIQKELEAGGIFCVMIPDEMHKTFFKTNAEHINSESTFIFAHGFSVGYQNIEIKANKVLLAPKAIAKVMRSRFLDAKTVPAVFCVDSKEQETLLSEIAESLGLSPLIKATFFQEAVSDMFTEQVLLCGGVPALLTKAFNILIQKGIPEKIALAECLHELIYILDVVSEKGISGMMEKISPVAAAGACKTWSNIDNKTILDEMLETAYSDIESGDFLNYLDSFDKKEHFGRIDLVTKDFDKAITRLKEQGVINVSE